MPDNDPLADERDNPGADTQGTGGAGRAPGPSSPAHPLDRSDNEQAGTWRDPDHAPEDDRAGEKADAPPRRPDV